jgi:proteasome lid subunit RPN8/RPN11
MVGKRERSTAVHALAIEPVDVDNASPVLYELWSDSTEIGSAQDNAIVLSGPGVVPHHLAIRRAGEKAHLLVDLVQRRRCRDLEWVRFKSGDVYWCPRHGRVERLDRSGRCPQCKRRRTALWLLRPLHPGDSFGIGKAFRATFVEHHRTSELAADASKRILPPCNVFETIAAPRKAHPRAKEPVIPKSALPTDDSNLWLWRPERAPFPIFLHQRVNQMITRHARENNQTEVGGLLLGDVARDANDQLFVVITNALRAEFAIQTRGHLTFTQETWRKLHQAHERQFPNKTIVGWYHTHPGWTIFLSEADLFIHRNFFKQPWQIALVLDPSLHQAGFFVWQGNDVSNPNQPLEPFRLAEVDGWGEKTRPRVRIKLMDTPTERPR